MNFLNFDHYFQPDAGNNAEKELKGKVVVITGAAEGIGYCIAESYLAEGIKAVILLDVNEERGAKALQTLSCKFKDQEVIFMKCDVTTDLEEVSKAIYKAFPQVDVLVNNAGAIMESCPPRNTIELNLIALMEWTLKFWENMRKDKGGPGGTILNVGSIYSYTVDPYLVFYKTSKFGVMGFSRVFGHQINYELFGVRVLVFCPGFTTTTMTGAKQMCWDEHVTSFNEYLKVQEWQPAEATGVGAVELFKKGSSGSAWKMVGSKLTEVCLVPEGDKLR